MTGQMEFNVEWNAEITASDPVEAAQDFLSYVAEGQIGRGFHVTNLYTGEVTEVDLEETPPLVRSEEPSESTLKEDARNRAAGIDPETPAAGQKDDEAKLAAAFRVIEELVGGTFTDEQEDWFDGLRGSYGISAREMFPEEPA